MFVYTEVRVHEHKLFVYTYGLHVHISVHTNASYFEIIVIYVRICTTMLHSSNETDVKPNGFVFFYT